MCMASWSKQSGIYYSKYQFYSGQVFDGKERKLRAEQNLFYSGHVGLLDGNERKLGGGVGPTSKTTGQH